MGKIWITLGATFAGIAVAAGAFAAHGLDRFFVEKYAGETRTVGGETISRARKYLDDFRTGAEYQMYHALGMIAVGLHLGQKPTRAGIAAAWCFLLGIVLFSGSLYLLTLTGITRWGAITPIGGVLFLCGWLSFAIAGSYTCSMKVCPVDTPPGVE